MNLPQVRAKAASRYAEYRAILIFLNRLTTHERLAIDSTLRQIPDLFGTQLFTLLEDVTSQIATLRREFGIAASPRDFEYFLSPKNSPLEPGKVLFISKHHLGQLITRYEVAFPLFKDLPPHAGIGIDVLGQEYETPRFEVQLLEASLFEDMASLWNSVAEIPITDEAPIHDIVQYKRLKALERATVRSAFALIEGYLNGLARDIYLTRKLSADDLERITEWGQSLERPRPLSLKDKISQYPKIAISASTPPLTASNNKVVAGLLEVEARVRHALIHPTPMGRGPSESKLWRDEIYFDVDRRRVEDCRDLVVQVILEIDKILDHKFGTVSSWLQPTEGGRYPDSVFR